MKSPQTNQTPTEPPLLSRAFVLLVCAQFLQALGYSSAPLLPLYLESMDATRAQIGLVTAAAAAGGLLFRPAVGWSLDSVGRKPTLITGTLLVSTMMVALVFARDVGPYIYVIRAIYGIGIGCLFSGYFAFAADLIPESRRTEGIALFGVAGLAPLAFNPIIGEMGVDPSNLRWFFAGVGVCVALSLVFLAQIPEAKKDADHQSVRLGEVWTALTQKRMAPVWVATVVFSGLVALYFAFSSVTAEHRGLERSTAMWVTYAAGAISIRLFGARLPDKLGTSNMVAPALAVYCLSYLITAATHSTAGFLVAGALAGLGHGYCFPVLSSQVITRMPDRLRGVGTSAFTAIWDVASIGLAPAFGLIADRYSDSVMFTSAVLLAIVMLGVWATLEHHLGGEGAD